MKKLIAFAASEYGLRERLESDNTPVGIGGGNNQFCPGVTIRQVYVEFATGHICEPAVTQYDGQTHFLALVIS